jgi:hypothetical protein
MCFKSVVFTLVMMSEENSVKEEEEISVSEEENGVVNNTQEPEENLPVAVSEVVGEENEPEFQPREAEKTRASRQTRPPRWHNDYARY